MQWITGGEDEALGGHKRRAAYRPRHAAPPRYVRMVRSFGRRRSMPPSGFGDLPFLAVGS